MVVSFVQLTVLLGIFVHCDSLSCFDQGIKEDGFLERKTTCEGDLCVYYQPGASVRFFEEKSCVTGLQLPLGCLHSSIDDSVMCICNTDYCNHGRIDESIEIPMHTCNVDLQTWFVLGHHDPIDKDNITEAGSFCLTTAGVNAETNVTEEFAGPMRGSEGYPLIPGVPDLSNFFFYTGIVHSFSMRSGQYRSIMYKCEQDFCNNVSISVLPVPMTIDCLDDEIPDSENSTCQGEFCVLAEDEYRKMSRRFCLSTYNLHSQHSYEVGLYKYKTTSYYLCQENGCNFNVTTAYKNITIEEEEPKIATGSFWSIKMLTPEYLLISLSVLSAVSFIVLIALVVMFVPMDPRYVA